MIFIAVFESRRVILTAIHRNRNDYQLIISFFKYPHKLFIFNGLESYPKVTRKYLM